MHQSTALGHAERDLLVARAARGARAQSRAVARAQVSDARVERVARLWTCARDQYR